MGGPTSASRGSTDAYLHLHAKRYADLYADLYVDANADRRVHAHPTGRAGVICAITVLAVIVMVVLNLPCSCRHRR